jgi:hypothetical protein
MAFAKEQRQKVTYLNAAGLALSVAITQAVFLRLITPATGFSLAEFAFAFVLAFSIAIGVSRQLNA